MALIDCFGKSKYFKEDEIVHFIKRSEEFQKEGLSKKEADIKAVQEAMGEVKDTMKSVYEQVGKPYSESKPIINEQEKGQEGLLTTEGATKQVESEVAPLPPSEPPPTEKIAAESGDNLSGITHEATEATRKEFGVGEPYEKKAKTDEELFAQADEQIKKGYNVGNLISDIEQGHRPNDVETTILKKYKAGLEAQIEKDPSDANLAQLDKLMKATDAIGTEQGREFRARKGLQLRDDSLANYFTIEKDVNLDAPLTEGQKATVLKEHKEITEANKAYRDKIAKLEEELAQKEAQKGFEKAKTTTKKSSGRTHDDFVKERTVIIDNIKDKLKKARGQTSATIVPYANELIAIAPDVAKLVANLVGDGITQLPKVVDAIHEQLKDVIDGITKKDVHDLIAGEYNQKKRPRNEIAKDIFELKEQARLMNKLDKLEAGIEPKNEKQKVKRNQEIDALRKQIKEHDLTKLAEYKSKTKSQIEKLENDLKTGNFAPAEKKAPIKLDKEGQKLKDDLVKLKQERNIRLLREAYQNRGKYEKTRDWLADKLNIPRTLMASMDYSAPFRQGLVAATAHPITAAKALPEMFKASFSQKHFDEWFFDLKESPKYDVIKSSGLAISDPHSPFLVAKEEAFMNNTAEKLPIVGKLVKGSERAYVMFLNKLRVDLFSRMMDVLESNGKTFENSPETYKALASLINNETGRGHLGVMENAAPILNSFLFSPRLIASRINLLTNWANPNFYRTVPKEIRVMYFKDMLKFIGVGLSVLALAKLNGADVEDDPRSSDFGKIKSGDTRYDIWGGFQQYIRLVTQVAWGEKKSTRTGEIQELDSKGRFGEGRGDVGLRFARGKLAPVPSMVADFFVGRTIQGEDVTMTQQLRDHLYPLIYSDVKDAMKDKGISSLFTVGIPAAFGIGVQTYDNKPIVNTKEKKGKTKDGKKGDKK